MSFRSNESDEEIWDGLIEQLNPENNVFSEGLDPAEANENKSICLRNVPNKLTRKAIENMLSSHGKVERVTIPQNQERFKDYKDGFIMVFAEFSTFL
jgi:RNA recognition motif-containing protein